MFRPMDLYLHNVRTRCKEVFAPQNPNRVTMYVCGPTVYGPAHIGNARPAVVFDVLARLLRVLYGADRLIYARNITDVDDKINQKAKEEGVDIGIISDRYKAKYHSDMGRLGVLEPDIEPHATAHISDMIAMIETLIARGVAYEAEGHVLFEVAKDSEYGSLSRRKQDDMIAGARVEVAPYKRDAADFVLWKPSAPDEPHWDSPWGKGRPGWHIECSAMIEKHLGTTIDIHGGGLDLQFPHHENECAQSRCAHNAPLAHFWLHNGLLNMSGEKMSKSLGNIRLVEELIKEYPGEVIRLALLKTHYRQPLDFTKKLLSECEVNLDALYGVLLDDADVEEVESMPPLSFMQAMCDDLNTPKAIAELFVLAKKADTPQGKGEFLAAGKMLGLLKKGCQDWNEELEKCIAGGDIDMVMEYVKEREEARKVKDFARADAARDKLDALGVAIEDDPDGAIRIKRKR